MAHLGTNSDPKIGRWFGQFTGFSSPVGACPEGSLARHPALATGRVTAARFATGFAATTGCLAARANGTDAAGVGGCAAVRRPGRGEVDAPTA